jgi:hypothetical protein
MSDLQNQTPANTYKGLLQVDDYTNGVNSTAKFVSDGKGANSALSISESKVGVGTAIPDSKLEIVDSSNHLNLKVANTVSQGVIKFSDSDGLACAINYDHNTDKLHFITDGTATPSNGALNIDSDGNVGIGTSPVTKLDINEVAGNLDVLQSFSKGGVGQARVGLCGATSQVLQGALADDLCIRSDGHNIRFGTASATRTDMTIDSDGRVGIGTSPVTKLHVKDFHLISGYTVQTTATGTTVQTSGDMTNVLSVGDTVQISGNIYTLTAVNSNAIILSSPAPASGGGLSIYVYIDALTLKNGNVGIGTVFPSAPLEVASTTGGVIMPRMDDSQRDAISSPTNGEMIFNTSTNTLNVYNGTAWRELTDTAV